MGTNAVGGMVVAGPEGFVKSQYRKFNIKSTDITPGDDFGMMREVMTRRFSRLLKEEGKPDRSQAGSEVNPADAADLPFPGWPDVILIDGGQGQMTAVRAILEELGITDSVIAIGVAKGVDRDAGRERFFPPGRESFTLPPRDPVLYFVQRLRDEAHRFAIGSHRARRKKEMVKNPARRDRRHRPFAQAGAAAAFRHREGGVARRPFRPAGRRRHLGGGGASGLQSFPRRRREITSAGRKFHAMAVKKRKQC